MNKRNKYPLKFLISILITNILVSACQSNHDEINLEPSPFVLSKFQLSKKNGEGETEWTIRSPEARYQLGKRLIRAINFEGTIFEKSLPTFNLSAKSANVVNDGDIILLEGDVFLNKLTGNKIKVKGDMVVWNTSDSILTIEQRPVAFDKNIILKSQKAKFDNTKNILYFSGSTNISSNSEVDSDSSGSKFNVQFNNGQWNFKTGNFKAEGPVRGVRLFLSNQKYQRIIGNSIYGNTNFGHIGLTQCKVYQSNDYIESQKCQWGWKDELIRFSGKVKLIRGISNSQLSNDSFTTKLSEDGLIIMD